MDGGPARHGGTDLSTFSPDTPTTRGMVVTILYRLSPLAKSETLDDFFSRLESDDLFILAGRDNTKNRDAKASLFLPF